MESKVSRSQKVRSPMGVLTRWPQFFYYLCNSQSFGAPRALAATASVTKFLGSLETRFKSLLSQYISYPSLKAWWVSPRDLSFLCQNSPCFYFWSLLPVLLLWMQPGNQILEQAACILHKVTVRFSHQDPILANSCLDRATANLLSDACFKYVVYGTFFKEKKTFFFYLLIILFFQILIAICR